MNDLININFGNTVYEKGYGILAKKVMQDQLLSKAAKLVYAYICTYGKGAFPGRNKICCDLRISKNTVGKGIHELVNARYISIEKQRGEGGRFSRNIYTIELFQKQSESF